MNYPVPASKNELTYMCFLYVKCIFRILLYMLIDLNCKQIRNFKKRKEVFEMLDARRLRTPCLFDKIVSADEAATLITDGMNVGVSGFTPSGYPKKTTLALAKAIKAGKKCRINIWSGASVGPEIEETLAEVGGISGRMPYYAASNKILSRQINTGSVTYIDQHLSHFAQQIDYGFYGDVDVAIVEAAAINADGSIVLGSGVGNTPMLVKHAKKIIVEVNTSIPLTLEGMHDIYICSKPPERTEIPIYHVGDRIGSPYVSCGLDRITCIVESDIVDHVRNLSAPDEASKKIAANLVDFLEHEQRHGRLPQQMLPLQSGVGSIANAVLMGLAESKFENLTMYSEILQDSVFKLIKCGKVTQASGCAFTPSPTVWEMYKEDPELYRNRIVLRPLDISNNPEVIRRLGVISMNTPLEFDIYGQANSTHVMGNRMMNGIGGSGDYMRNGYLTIFSTPSTAKGGNISSVVPMVSHADHTEHDTMVFITEQGVADIRGLSPLKRAKLIIEKCAHPDFREQLYDYLKMAQRKNGHEPVDLEHAFDMHIALEKTGTMKEQSKEENHYDYTRRFTA